MRYLLDTNVISELIKPRPNQDVVAWLEATDEHRVYLSVVAFAEIRLGIEQLPAGRRRQALTAWLEDDVVDRFEGRIIGIDVAIADAWARLVAAARALGEPPPLLDAFVAATALVHRMTLVTRNERHVRALGVPILNPWTASPSGS